MHVLSRCNWSPATTGPPGPSAAIFVAIDGPPDQVWQTMTATDGPALPQVVPLYLSMLHAINDTRLAMYLAAFIGYH